MLRSISLLGFIFIAITSCSGQEPDVPSVCFNDVGCFSLGFPFNIEGNILPTSPEAIQTNFLLFTPTNKQKRQSISYKDTKSIRNSDFNSNLNTKFIVHGFAGNVETQWMHDLKNEILDVENANVIIVGWGKGAEFPSYLNASANVRVVAREVAILVKNIKNVFSPNRFNIHCIGHSLGAQLCGQAGSQSEVQFSRISALDPAGPFFEDTDKAVHVDKTDAQFVDVMHTNAGLIQNSQFGMKMATGHMDFYVNGGEFQTGCPSLVQVIIDCIGNFEACKGDPSSNIGCSHNRSYKMFIESIKSACSFLAFTCESREKYERGECTSCQDDKCAIMGYYADSYKSPGSHYLATYTEAPFCGNQYLFEVKTSDSSEKTAGEILLTLEPSQGTKEISAIPQNTEIEASKKIGKVFVAPKNKHSDDTNIAIQFKKKIKIFGRDPNSKILKVDKIKLVNLDSQTTMSFCQKNFELVDKETVDTLLTVGDCKV